MPKPGTNLIDRLGRGSPRGLHALGIVWIVEEGQLRRRFPKVPRTHSDETDPSPDHHFGQCIFE